MNQRASGYARVASDAYHTPAWVTKVLLKHIPEHIKTIWEPSSGADDMANVLTTKFDVFTTDIKQGENFLAYKESPETEINAIITNPPYDFATEFCHSALRMMKPRHGFVAMLLRIDFDSAKTRRDLFGNCGFFSGKLILLDRIKWFDDPDKKANRSYNHAWFIWSCIDNAYRKPQIYYASKGDVE